MINHTRHKRKVTKSVSAGHTSDFPAGGRHKQGAPCKFHTICAIIGDPAEHNQKERDTKQKLGLNQQQKEPPGEWAGFSLITKDDLFLHLQVLGYRHAWSDKLFFWVDLAFFSAAWACRTHHHRPCLAFSVLRLQAVAAIANTEAYLYGQFSLGRAQNFQKILQTAVKRKALRPC